VLVASPESLSGGVSFLRAAEAVRRSYMWVSVKVPLDLAAAAARWVAAKSIIGNICVEGCQATEMFEMCQNISLLDSPRLAFYRFKSHQSRSIKINLYQPS
jgi:hypothetical protein